MLSSVVARLTRKKRLHETGSGSGLSRCLTTLDLTLLGIGSTLGVGVYVLAGSVSRDKAGPSTVLSFLVAGLASAMSGLCYAEFGARVPKAGSAYVYSYVTVGELPAFIIGWNLILEYVIGTASVARGYSNYLDTLLNHAMQDTYCAAMPLNVPFLAACPDWTAFSITCLLAVLLAAGVKESSRFNNVFTVINLLIISFVIIAGFTQADLANWSLAVNQSLPLTEGDNLNYGHGGFFPFGFSGTLAGAATCFFAFVGFDAIATTGEETLNPQKSIPRGIIISLCFVALAYAGISSVLTLMVPPYLQDRDAPLPAVFQHVGLPWASTLVTIGGLFGLSTSLLGAMFPLPRVLYAMATDGLLPRSLSSVHLWTLTPLLATLTSGVFAATMALLFDLTQLVEMMSIGTLMAYTMVAVCVLILRYRYGNAADSRAVGYTRLSTNDLADSEEELFPCDGGLKPGASGFSWRSYLRQMFLPPAHKGSGPTELSSTVSSHLIILFSLACIPPSLSLPGSSVCLLLCLVAPLLLCRQPQDVSSLPFSVPLVPGLPCFSVAINIFLTMQLSWQTWLRFSVWMACGMLLYVCYGWWNSSEEYRMLGEVPPNERKEDLLHAMESRNSSKKRGKKLIT